MTIAVERINSKRSPVWLRFSHQARFDFVSPFVREKIVLDLACGEATSSQIYLEAGATRVLAGDFSTPTLIQARRRLASEGILFLNCDATTIPLPDDSLDIYASLETIEHIPDDCRYLAEAGRLVRPEGCFLCSTPNRDLTNPGRLIQDRPWNPYHVREYSLPEFTQLLNSYWGEVVIYGQSPKPAAFAKVIARVGKSLPGYWALHFLQLLKLFKLIHDRPDKYVYEKVSDTKTYENLLGVCRNPRKPV